ncbi:MAG: phosphotransferase [Armatimonadetes bacterium]|nr:phosphotransferase [Armatimonadota bacterium]
MSDYADLSQRRQIAVMRRGLEDLLEKQNVQADGLRLAAHAYNTTFRAVINGQDTALRVNTNSNRSLSEVRGEVAWVQSILESGLDIVPHPLPIFSGSPIGLAHIAGIEQECPVVAYSWLPGRHVREGGSINLARHIGAIMNSLHKQADGVVLPPGAERREVDTVLIHLEWRLPDRAPFQEVFKAGNKALDRLRKEQKAILTHFDLHAWNVKMHQGKAYVFDFDDAEYAWPAADAAQSIGYLRAWKQHEEVESAFWKGLKATPETLGVSQFEFEAMVAGRSLLLANDILGNNTAEIREIGPKYLTVVEKRLSHFLQTGRFDPKVATMKDA